MDFLRQEIARKKKETSELALQGLQNGTKYIRQADRQALELKKLLDAQAALDEERRMRETEEVKMKEVKALKIASRNDTISSAATGADSGKTTEAASSASHIASLTTAQVKAKLRALAQPITLFAESDDERRERLSCALSTERIVDDALHQDDDDDGDYDDDDDDEDERGGKEGGANKGKRSKKTYDPSIHFSKIPGLPKTKMIHKYFKMMLKLWERDLDAREESVKSSTKGREETKLVKQVHPFCSVTTYSVYLIRWCWLFIYISV